MDDDSFLNKSPHTSNELLDLDESRNRRTALSSPFRKSIRGNRGWEKKKIGFERDLIGYSYPPRGRGKRGGARVTFQLSKRYVVSMRSVYIRDIYFIRNVTSLRTRTSGCSCWRYNYGGPRWWHALSTRRLGKGVQYLYKAWMKMLPAIHSHLSHKPAHEANLPEESRGKIGNVFVSRQKDFASRWVAQPCSRTTRFPLETFKFPSSVLSVQTKVSWQIFTRRDIVLENYFFFIRILKVKCRLSKQFHFQNVLTFSHRSCLSLNLI